jgi:hypothetical protein
MEYSLDAPWRIEPTVDTQGRRVYGAIPIQVSIHDADLIPLDPPERRPAGTPVRTLGNFCSLTVEERSPTLNRRRHYGLDDLAEIETSRRWRSPVSPAPAHRVCRPDDAPDRCEGMRGLWGTAEWHAVAWYYTATRTPGSDIPLALTATVTSHGSIGCGSASASDLITLRNHATVHLGEAALPRFDEAGWLYGDLHYHSQGTDNEGESAYNYRGVLRAMGALGLDFAFAAEHASNSRQIIDAEVDRSWCGVEGTTNSNALRDMSVARFRFLNDQLHGAAGANRTAALAGPQGRLPQGYLSHGVIPQIFLGGEVDAIPEAETGDRYITYGNGLRYDTDLLGKGKKAFADCLVSKAYTLRSRAANGWLMSDVQGINDVDYGREHLVYLPRVGTDVNAFVASNTGVYGGAGRRLAERHQGRPPLLPEIERKGYAFLAHPLNDGAGSPGPDGPPWSDFMIRKAWRSRAVLGLQFWNEPTHLRTSLGNGAAVERGYDFDGSFIDHQADLAESQRLGFARGTFELVPYYGLATRTFHSWSRGLESRLHHGAFTWDNWLLRGLNTNETRQLSWLPDGEPRRFFIAAGSDAHGDLNYRRAGYFTGTTSITDVAIAKARNLVFAGRPTLPRDENIPPDWGGKPAERHSHTQVVRALANGNFSATDGPALRIVVDRNRNGRIDGRDTPMGGVVELFGEEQLPLIVQWRSTPEFGPVTRLSLYVGARNDRAGVDGNSRVYAPAAHGPRNGAALPRSTVVQSYSRGSRTYARMQDNYWRDPTGLLNMSLPNGSLSGERLVMLPLRVFEAARLAPGDRFYVRAFAETARRDPGGCAQADFASIEASRTPGRQGACTRHYAFTNPIWAIARPVPVSGCQPSARALDRDGDGLPDGCDP